MSERVGRTHPIVSFILFMLLVVGAGLAIGWLTVPGDWYAQLQKPAFNPPNWIFAPVWSVLYVCIAIAGWRIWQRDASLLLLALWAAQLVLNLAWSPTFFAAHRIGIALGIVLLLLVTILAVIVVGWREDRCVAWLFVPYAAWVGFAAVLNGAILMLN
jgi:benzodiazapine receptor